MFTPCSSLQDFITSLDYYINPPAKRQRVDEQGKAKKITLPSLNSFLEVNKEWMPLAKTNATARAKFRELAESFKKSQTRSSERVGKRLREAGLPELPQEMLLQVLNVATYRANEWVEEYAKLSLVNSQWEPLAIRALAEKINREQIPIIELNISENLFDFVISMGPLITHLDLNGLEITQEEITQITASFPHLTFLSFDSKEEISLNLTGLTKLKELFVFSMYPIKLNNSPSLEILDLYISGSLSIPSFPSLKKLKIFQQGGDLTLPGMPRLELLDLTTFAKNFTLPTFPALKNLEVMLYDASEIHFQPQPELRALDFRANAVTRFELTDFPNLAEAELVLPRIGIVNFKHLHKLETLSIKANELSHFILSDSVKHLNLEVRQSDLNVESLALEHLKIISSELNTLRLGNLPNLKNLELLCNSLENAEFNTKYSRLEELFIYSNLIERLTLPLFPNLGKVDLNCPRLNLLNFQSIARAKSLNVKATSKLMLEMQGFLFTNVSQ